MKFFAAVKQAEFAKAAFTAAGLNLDAAHAENKTSVISDALKAAKPDKDYEALLAEAVKENEAATAKIAAQSKAFADACAAADLPLNAVTTAEGAIDPAKFKAAVDALATKKARVEMAKNGHDPIPETPADDPTKKSATKTKTMADFKALSHAERARFCAEVNAGKAKLTE